jgi:hypothetical protein
LADDPLSLTTLTPRKAPLASTAPARKPPKTWRSERRLVVVVAVGWMSWSVVIEVMTVLYDA